MRRLRLLIKARDLLGLTQYPFSLLTTVARSVHALCIVCMLDQLHVPVMIMVRCNNHDNDDDNGHHDNDHAMIMMAI